MQKGILLLIKYNNVVALNMVYVNRAGGGTNDYFYT